jgi:hypothetical protein
VTFPFKQNCRSRCRIDALASVAAKVDKGGTLYVVDLRQESHVFFNDRAVSWYADMDWANVGQTEAWIRRDEASQIKSALEPGTNAVKIFCVDETSKSAGRLVPTGYSEVQVNSAASEEHILQKMKLSCDCPISAASYPPCKKRRSGAPTVSQRERKD